MGSGPGFPTYELASAARDLGFGDAGAAELALDPSVGR